MRTIELTARFKKDYKREVKGAHKAGLKGSFEELLELLIKDNSLPIRYQDHSLSGSWSDHRDCHLKPDLVLIYRKPDKKRLQLVRLGSHAELGL